jgi:ATP-dependent exoDNAse (exonuclease V) beta subunit
LVHAVLALCSFDPRQGEVERLVASQGRALGATEDEQLAAVAAVGATLAHPVVRRAARSADCRREVPLACREPDVIAEGIADLVFLDPDEGGYHVVDFKTDVTDDGLSAYQRQLALYGRAVARATGQSVRASILRV